MSRFIICAVALVTLLQSAICIPTRQYYVPPPHHRNYVTPAKPVCGLNSDFADPAVIKVGNRWYGFATTSHGRHVQVACSEDFRKWTHVQQDALPDLPGWVAHDPAVWAPDVIQRADGKFVLYFSAAHRNESSKHCVGVATSSNPAGPYKAEEEPFACPLDQGGAIDAAGFFDPKSNCTYVVYKVDGNSKNTAYDYYHPTPLMLQEVASDGITHHGEPIRILDRATADGPLVEAPSLALSPEGIYFLFFSSNMYDTQLYDISYATANDIKGPYTKTGTPFMKTGDINGITAPGGADIAPDTSWVVFHSHLNGNNIRDGRSMWLSTLTTDGTVASLGGLIGAA
ncbi:MAG: hypothetical protein M1816_000500 [Peltula sp. TS41687]|nr:MAG: hypothetical protein M1816_000500 [Peltula sp. TS41687]